MADWPTIADMNTQLGAGRDQAVLAKALDAAVASIQRETVYGAEVSEIPDDVHYATILMAGVLYGRKNTPSGIAGDNEFGLVRINSFDPNINELLEPHLTLDGFA